LGLGAWDLGLFGTVMKGVTNVIAARLTICYAKDIVVQIMILTFGPFFTLVERSFCPKHYLKDYSGVGVMMQLTGHWAETVLSVLLAIGIGLILRIVIQGG